LLKADGLRAIRAQTSRRPPARESDRILEIVAPTKLMLRPSVLIHKCSGIWAECLKFCGLSLIPRRQFWDCTTLKNDRKSEKRVSIVQMKHPKQSKRFTPTHSSALAVPSYHRILVKHGLIE